MGAAVKTKAVQTSLTAMRGFTSPLWPVRYKPLPDELLSCWLVRLAHGHGLKIQTFCNLIFGSHHQVWNRDIDRLAPAWLVDELCRRTGVSRDVVWNATLRAYEGVLYRKFRMSGALQWILALKMYHRKREGHGLQLCPTCLAGDSIPYFRKCWRVASNTVCVRHGTMLLDRCPKCYSAVVPHRIDIGRHETSSIVLMPHCHACAFDFRKGKTLEPLSYDVGASKLLAGACRMLSSNENFNDKWNFDRYVVAHQLCRILTERSRHVRLREFVLDHVEFHDIPLTEGHVSFEMRPIEERHHLIQLTAWLMVDLKSRLTSAWRAQAVRYNVLLKGLAEPPDWYGEIVNGFANWRNRTRQS